MGKILIGDSDAAVLEDLGKILRSAGYEVWTARNGARLLALAREKVPDLVVTEIDLPEMDGFDVLRQLQRDPVTGSASCIFLTARNTELDRVLGLELGADDYIVKPHSGRELLLRIRKRLERRVSPLRKGVDDAETYQVGDLRLIIPSHRVEVAGKDVPVTATEFNLLRALIREGGRVLSRDRLLRNVWEYGENHDSRTVDTHVRRLRVKLGKCARLIRTVRGVGYRLGES